MAHSFCKIYLHIIFSTKNRQRWLDETIRPRLHAYLATLARNAGCPFVIVGGPEDHIHILADIGKKVQPVAMVGHIKQESSKFVKTLGTDYRQFYWQQGYATFSVGPTRVDDVKKYIERQEEHHQRQTFQEEFKAFLDRYEIEYDEKYIWE
jgi:putative transposase